MLKEVPLPRLFEIWDVRLSGPDEEVATWAGVVFFDNLNGSIERDVLGVLPIGPAGSHVSCHVPIPLQGTVFQGEGAIFCDQQVYVPRDAFIRRRGTVPDRLRKRLLRETWNQLPSTGDQSPRDKPRTGDFGA